MAASIAWLILPDCNLGQSQRRPEHDLRFQGIGLHPTNPNIVIGGSQDNGTELTPALYFEPWSKAAIVVWPSSAPLMAA